VADEQQPAFLKTINALNTRYLIDVPGVREVWLVRHADPYRGLGNDNGDTDDPALSPLGELQARHLAQRLAAVAFQAVWSSPARRTQQTAAAVVRGRPMPVRTDPRLREVRTHWDESRTSVLRPPGEYPFPEPANEVVERVGAVISGILAELEPRGPVPARAVLIGHTAATLIYLTNLLGLQWGQLRTILGLTSVSVVAYKDDLTVVRSIGDVTHLANAEYEDLARLT
jgi:broad specificity phosphatase PhoE